MDNFEWAEGYTERFGLHWIDFNDDQRPRVAKESVECYKEIMRRSFPGDVDDLEYCRFQVDADPGYYRLILNSRLNLSFYSSWTSNSAS